MAFKAQAAPLIEHVGNFVEGLHQAELDRSVLFGFAEHAAAAFGPGCECLGTQKNADSENRLPVRGHVEDELGRGSFGIIVERGSLSDKIVLVNVAGLSSVGFDTADGHRRLGIRKYCSPAAPRARWAARAEWLPPSPSSPASSRPL